MEKIPAKFDPDFINRIFYPNETKINRLDLINYGQCCDWSYLSYLCWKSAVRLWSCCCHAFTKVDGKFYDSEAVDGVDAWQDLRTCRELNCSEGIFFVNTQDYMDDWAPQNKHWIKLRKTCWDRVYR